MSVVRKTTLLFFVSAQHNCETSTWRAYQILGNTEAFEPFTSNIYSRRVLSGDFVVVNKYMMSDLMKLGLWSPAMKNRIVAERGSIQGIPGIPVELKELYKTVWEIKMKVR